MVLKLFRLRGLFVFMHVLFVAGVFDGDCVVVDGVGVVPMSCMCHVPSLVLPSFEGRASAKQ